jgi:lipopolysaccharide transport system ATP-binding protein
MQAIAQLTKRCILLSKGNIQFDGHTDKAVRLYIAGQQYGDEQPAFYTAPESKTGNHVAWAKVHDSEGQGVHCWGEPITFEFALSISHPHESLWFSFQVLNELQQGICIFWFNDPEASFRKEPGLFILQCKIPKFRLYMGSYSLRTWLSERRGNTLLENLNQICPFEVTMHGYERAEYEFQADECTYLEDAAWVSSKSNEAQLSTSMNEKALKQ